MIKQSRVFTNQNIAVVILIVFVIIQSRYSLFSRVNQFIFIYRNLGQPAVWRGASYYGNRFANFVAFLNQEIPDDALVVLPPRGHGFDPLTRTQYMQYFLYPRKIVNCTGSYFECMEFYSDWENAYIVIVEADRFSVYPGEQPGQRLRMFNPENGVLVPPDAPPNGGQNLRLFPSLIAVGLAIVQAVLILGGLALGGGLFSETFLPDLNPLQHLGLGFGIGSGVFSILLTIPLLAGWKLNSGLVFGIYFLLLVSFVILYLLKTGAPRWPEFLSFQTFYRERWLLPLFGLSLIMVFLAFGLGYHRDDSLGIWAPKGYGIAAAGFPNGPTRWGTLTTEYPLHIPLLIAAMRKIFEENLPESKLIFPFYATSTLVVVYVYFREITTRVIAFLCTLLIGTVPVFFQQSIIAYANLPAAYFSLSGVLLWQRSTESQRRRSLLVLAGGVFIAFASWTRPEMILIGLVVTIWFAWQFLRSGRPWIEVLWIATPIIVFQVFWFITKRLAYSQSGFTSGLFRDILAGVLNGQFNFSVMYQVAEFVGRELLSPSVWGMVGWSAVAGVVVLLFLRNRLRLSLSPQLMIGCLYILATLGGYYLTSFLSTRSSIDFWVRTVNRMILPGVLLVWMAIARVMLARITPELNYAR